VAGEAGNGHEALAIFRDLRPPLVTLDLVMPELGGLDALVEMKALDPEVTVVIISALQQREVFREAFRRGASDFLVKPVDSQRLQAMFHRAESHQATSR
jgi:two-component system chemotaxis response regulator CheY